MRVTIPVTITPAKLSSSTLADVFVPAAYAAGTTYAFGALVSVDADYAKYESLTNSNIGNTPLTSPAWWRKVGVLETAYNVGTSYPVGATASSSDRVYQSLTAANIGNPLPVLPLTTTAFWLDIGPTNKWAMLDLYRNTQSVSASTITVVITPGERINTCALVGVVGSSVTISATSVLGGGTVYSYTESLTIRTVLDHYMYAFEPFASRPGLVKFNLPPFTDIIVTISISATVGNVKCAGVLVGTYAFIGDAQYDAESDQINFSLINRDVYGTATLVPRPSVPKTQQTLMLDKSKVDFVYDLRDRLNAVVALWTGLDDSTDGYFGMLLIVGVYKRFTINAKDFAMARINLELEEI